MEFASSTRKYMSGSIALALNVERAQGRPDAVVEFAERKPGGQLNSAILDYHLRSSCRQRRNSTPCPSNTATDHAQAPSTARKPSRA